MKHPSLSILLACLSTDDLINILCLEEGNIASFDTRRKSLYNNKSPSLSKKNRHRTVIILKEKFCISMKIMTLKSIWRNSDHQIKIKEEDFYSSKDQELSLSIKSSKVDLHSVSPILLNFSSTQVLKTAGNISLLSSNCTCMYETKFQIFTQCRSRKNENHSDFSRLLRELIIPAEVGTLSRPARTCLPKLLLPRKSLLTIVQQLCFIRYWGRYTV